MDHVEKGENLPAIMKKIVQLKKKNRDLRWDNLELLEEKKLWDNKVSDLEKKAEYSQRKNKTLNIQLLLEIKLNQEIAKRSNALADKCKQDIKMVLGICRVPRLCKMFQQAC